MCPGSGPRGWQIGNCGLLDLGGPAQASRSRSLASTSAGREWASFSMTSARAVAPASSLGADGFVGGSRVGGATLRHGSTGASRGGATRRQGPTRGSLGGGSGGATLRHGPISGSLGGGSGGATSRHGPSCGSGGGGDRHGVITGSSGSSATFRHGPRCASSPPSSAGGGATGERHGPTDVQPAAVAISSASRMANGIRAVCMCR